MKKYEDDPLVWHGGMKAKLSVCCLKAFEHIKSKMADIHIPYLTVHGSDDKITDVSGAKNLQENAASSDKTLTVKYSCNWLLIC